MKTLHIFTAWEEMSLISANPRVMFVVITSQGLADAGPAGDSQPDDSDLNLSDELPDTT